MGSPSSTCMKFYFRLQIKRFFRKSTEWGVHPYWGIALLALAFCLFSYFFFLKVPYPPYFYSFVGLNLIFQLGTFTRNEFLKNIFSKPIYQRIRLAENFLLGMPFAIVLVIHQYYWLSLAVLLCGASFSLFNRINRSVRVIPSPFSGRPFEFTIGFRNTYWITGLLYILLFISMKVGNFNLGIFSQLGILILCMSFYSTPEPPFYVWIYSMRARGFLIHKLITALLYSALFCLPVVIALLIAYPAKFLITSIVFLLGLLYMLLIVLAKYTHYPEEMELTKILEMTICFLAPPALLFMIPHFYNESVKRLNHYLK